MEKQLKTLICCIAKMENHYIREWVEWYKNIGITNICLYDNNDIDGEHFDTVIGDYIDSGFVIIKNIRGLKSNKDINLQTQSYQECYDEYGNIYDWIGFFDADEYLEIENNKSISTFLSEVKFKEAEAIRVCWKNYDDNDLIETPNDYSINRFKTLVNPNHICNRISKVLIKGRQNNIKIYQRPGGEHGQYLNCKTLDCNGNIHNNDTFVLKERVWAGAWLRHYRFKTINEYINLKLKRLYPNVDDNLAKRMLSLKDFFEYNKMTKEKIDFYEKNINILGIKTLLCCIGRLENQYIREYVEYYKNLGITNICLFDNNYDGEEDFNDVIGDYISNGFVILKDYRNKKVCQLEAYDECYKKYGKEYDWIAFFDIDEFMFINENKKINEYLSSPEFLKYDMVHINWMLFGDGGQLKNDGRPLLQRIIKPLDINSETSYNFPDNFHVKSIIRGHLNTVLWNQTPHTPTNNLKCCNASGEECTSNSPFTPYDFRKAGLLHFTTKTVEEFALKVKRGFPDGNPTTKEQMIESFFKRNKVTKEKIQIFKEILNIDMSHLLPYEGEKNKDIQIYSLCYDKKKFAFINDEVVTPLQVGAANGTEVCELKDNTGDNISDKNYFYIENTGTYWIWKNIKDAKYKGQMQYRRPLEGINGKTNFEDIFSKYKVITCEPFHHPSHKTPTEEQPMVIIADTVEQGYAFSNCIDDLYVLEMVIDLFYPEYKESYKKYIKEGPNLYYSNGFIMKSEDYDRYCEFLFGCLEKYQQFVDVSTPQRLMERVKYNMTVGKYPKHMRPQTQTPGAIRWQMSIGGFLSERIWTLWLLHNFKEEEILKLPYTKMEENMYT